MRTEVNRVGRALQESGIEPGRPGGLPLPNLPEMLVAHFAVPLVHGVLVAINTRLSGPEIAYILDHSGASILVVDTALYPTVAPHLADRPALREVVTVHDAHSGRRTSTDTSYARFVARGDDTELPMRVDDEERVISINYTSGTTGRPKGVMYTHRGAHLNALAEVIHSRCTPRHRVPVDAADVPLQRLVHHVGRHRHRRPPRLSASRSTPPRSGG
jgi:fatty-acyl-CoA synthase